MAFRIMSRSSLPAGRQGFESDGWLFETKDKPLIFLFEDYSMRMGKMWIVFLCCFIPFSLWAQGHGGKAGFDFLRLEMGARPASMGGAFVSVIGDLHGLTYNPASLVGVRDMEVTFTYLDHLLDIKSGFVGFSKSFNRAGQMGIGIFYTNYGELRRTDISGEDLGSFSPGDFVVSVTQADSLPWGFRYGVSVKYIQSSIDQYTANGLAADLGIIYCIPSQDLNIGLGILNVGAAMNTFVDVREKLPTSYRLGLSKRLAHLPLLLNFNLIKYQYDESSIFWGLYWALGGEFTVTENFYLRWGYNSRGSEENVRVDSDRFAGISLGLGIRYRKYRLDYGYCSYGVLGIMNYFTVTMSF